MQHGENSRVRNPFSGESGRGARGARAAGAAGRRGEGRSGGRGGRGDNRSGRELRALAENVKATTASGSWEEALALAANARESGLQLDGR